MKESVKVEGSFDTNIWYSKNDNTETEVVSDKISYTEEVPIKTLEDYDGQDEIIVRMIKQPTCTKAEIKDGKIEYTIEETIATEIVGDTKIRVGINEEETTETEVDEEINDEVKEDFLNEK